MRAFSARSNAGRATNSPWLERLRHVCSVARGHDGERGRARPFQRASGIGFAGEAKGSKAIASLIQSGLRNPDVFLSADPALYPGLVPFGRADLVVAYEPDSNFASRFDRVRQGAGTLAALLQDPSVRCGRTDPAVDPKGVRSSPPSRPSASRTSLPAISSPRHPIVRVSTGQIDCGFFYTTETRTTGLIALPLPSGIGSRHGAAAEYAVLALPSAPHPEAARAFVEFILHGAGRRLLEKAGLQFISG